jgi:uncharacterized Tic20 family protein
MRAEDRPYAALAHFFAAIPLWGIVFNWILAMSFKEKSRDVAFHAHQGIFFQIFLLAVFVIAALFHLFFLLVIVVNHPLGDLLIFGNKVLFFFIFVVYVLICLYGAIAVLDGRDFEYPYIGRRLRGSQQQ